MARGEDSEVAHNIVRGSLILEGLVRGRGERGEGEGRGERERGEGRGRGRGERGEVRGERGGEEEDQRKRRGLLSEYCLSN